MVFVSLFPYFFRCLVAARSGKLAKVINAKVGAQDWAQDLPVDGWVASESEAPGKFASANRKRRTALAFLLNCELWNASWPLWPVHLPEMPNDTKGLSGGVEVGL